MAQKGRPAPEYSGSPQRRGSGLKPPPLRGIYGLALYLAAPREIQVGRLGRFSFPAGHYLYLGSALGSLNPRLERHWAGSGPRRWHIDYLRAVAMPVAAAYAETAGRRECRWAQAAAALPGAVVVAPRFGASDCRCAAHLLHFPDPPLEALERALGQPLRRWRPLSRRSSPPG